MKIEKIYKKIKTLTALSRGGPSSRYLWEYLKLVMLLDYLLQQSDEKLYVIMKRHLGEKELIEFVERCMLNESD
jgi:hypothetical protein